MKGKFLKIINRDSLCLRREAEVTVMLLAKAGESDLVTILVSKLFISIGKYFLDLKREKLNVERVSKSTRLKKLEIGITIRN